MLSLSNLHYNAAFMDAALILWQKCLSSMFRPEGLVAEEWIREGERIRKVVNSIDPGCSSGEAEFMRSIILDIWFSSWNCHVFFEDGERISGISFCRLAHRIDGLPAVHIGKHSAARSVAHFRPFEHNGIIVPTGLTIYEESENHAPYGGIAVQNRIDELDTFFTGMLGDIPTLSQKEALGAWMQQQKYVVANEMINAAIASPAYKNLFRHGAEALIAGLDARDSGSWTEESHIVNHMGASWHDDLIIMLEGDVMEYRLPEGGVVLAIPEYTKFALDGDEKPAGVYAITKDQSIAINGVLYRHENGEVFTLI